MDVFGSPPPPPPGVRTRLSLSSTCLSPSRVSLQHVSLQHVSLSSMCVSITCLSPAHVCLQHVCLHHVCLQHVSLSSTWLGCSSCAQRSHGEQYLFAALMVGHRAENVMTPRGQVMGVVSRVLGVLLGLHTACLVHSRGFRPLSASSPSPTKSRRHPHALAENSLSGNSKGCS